MKKGEEKEEIRKGMRGGVWDEEERYLQIEEKGEEKRKREKRQVIGKHECG